MNKAIQKKQGVTVVQLGTGHVAVSHCHYEGEPLTHVVFVDAGEDHEVGSEAAAPGTVFTPPKGSVVIHCSTAEAAGVVVDAFTRVRDALNSNLRR